MKYLLPALLLIALLPACKKKELEPSFKATLNGAAYPPTGLYPNWNNWQNGATLTALGPDTMLIVSSQWGFTDTNYAANQYTPYARLEFDIRGLGDSITGNLTIAEKFLSLIKTGDLNYCSSASYGRCASIRTLDNNGNTVASTDLGDNTGSSFNITANGAQTNINNTPLTTYSANFTCKLYSASGGAGQTFTGTCTCIVTY